MPKISKVDEILRKLATEPLNTTDDIYNAIEEAKAELRKMIESKRIKSAKTKEAYGFNQALYAVVMLFD